MVDRFTRCVCVCIDVSCGDILILRYGNDTERILNNCVLENGERELTDGLTK